jgi:hypothetical protein
MSMYGQPVPDNASTHGSRPELWRTPSVAEEKNQNTSTQIYLQNQVGATLKAWQTPRQADAAGVGYQYDQGNHQKPRLMLPGQAKAWATPQSKDAKGAQGRMIRDGTLTDLPSQTEVEQTGAWNRNNGKLNPRWVCVLMNLPVFWVKP